MLNKLKDDRSPQADAEGGTIGKLSLFVLIKTLGCYG
jgi:hypothetical protein